MNTQSKNKNKVAGIILILVVVVCAGVITYYDRLLHTTNVEHIVETVKISTFAKSLKPIFSRPKRLVVDSIQMDLNLVPVEVGEEGVMEVPRGWDIGGWFRGSALAGEEKNLVINAHYDTDAGSPAAFWKLKNVRVGDTVVVYDVHGRSFSYKITEISYVGIDDSSRLDILRNQDGVSTITLITCGGVWSDFAHTYSARLVVKGEFLSMIY